MIEKFNQEIVDGLIDVMVNVIGDRSYDGITYSLYTGSAENDAKVVNQIKEIRGQIKALGFEPDDVIRFIKVQNGIIFDMSLQASREVNRMIAKIVGKQTGNKAIENADLVNVGPEKRRKQDIELLVKHLINECKKGNEVSIVALFSKNHVPKIVYTAKNARGEDVKVTVNSFAIRYWDMGTVNELMMQQGYCISKVRLGEILPTKTGVRTEVSVSKIR